MHRAKPTSHGGALASRLQTSVTDSDASHQMLRAGGWGSEALIPDDHNVSGKTPILLINHCDQHAAAAGMQRRRHGRPPRHRHPLGR